MSLKKDEDLMAPKALLDQCKEINEQWICNENIIIMPYLQGSSDTDDKWLFCIYNKITDQKVCEYLQPEKVDGHTLRLLIKMSEGAYDTGFINGRLQAIIIQMKKQCSELGISFDAVKNKINKG